MQNLHPWRSVLLLVVLLLGGVGAPWVHHLEHTDAPHATHQAAGLPGDKAGDVETGRAAYHDLLCHFCLRLFSAHTRPVQLPGALLREVAQPSLPAVLRGSDVSVHRSIRAPPYAA